MPMELSDEELATVLAALRHWQQSIRQSDLGEAVIQYIPLNFQLHFLAHSPLTHEEIDELCERLNCRR